MTINRTLAVAALLSAAFPALAQLASQPQLKVEPANRTLTVTATESVTAEPDLAILHVGFQTAPTDAKSAYAGGARTSNAIIDALKSSGIPASDIRSESQYLQRDYTIPESYKYRLTQQWTVRTGPERTAEILDIAVRAGANTSGQIEWTAKDTRALEEQALDKAAARARENAAVLAKGMGVRLGALIYVSNQLSSPVYPRPMMQALAMAGPAEAAPPLAIEPQKVSREATVYAVFAIE